MSSSKTKNFKPTKNQILFLSGTTIGLASLGIILYYVFKESDSHAYIPLGPENKANEDKVAWGMTPIEIAKLELDKGVKDVFEGYAIDKSGSLYSCREAMLPTGDKQESALPIFNYLESVGEYGLYYGNDVRGTACSFCQYSWCGAFVAYCWKRVREDIRINHFASVSSIVAWAGQDPNRFVSNGRLEAGDILIFQRPGSSSGHHMGLFEGYLSDGRVSTIEGNTYGFGQAEGVCRLYRYFKGNAPSGESYISCAIRPLSTDLA